MKFPKKFPDNFSEFLKGMLNILPKEISINDRGILKNVAESILKKWLKEFRKEFPMEF